MGAMPRAAIECIREGKSMERAPANVVAALRSPLRYTGSMGLRVCASALCIV
jgi:hypothetical protein